VVEENKIAKKEVEIKVEKGLRKGKQKNST
jgi:hypothetical protein